MPIRTPPQHNTDRPPGQTASSGTSYNTPSQMFIGPNKPIVTLGDYVEQLQASEARLFNKKTFNEWLETIPFQQWNDLVQDCDYISVAELAWKAGQENI